MKNEINSKTQGENQISTSTDGFINISSEKAKEIIDTEDDEIVRE